MTRRRLTTTILLTGAFLASGPASALAPQGGRPVIEKVRLYTDGDSLLCDVTSSGLLGERIAGTVRSGLPAVVELFYDLSSKGRGGPVKGMRSWSLRYDVWENVYSVSDGDTTVTLSSIESMERMVSRLEGISIVPLSRLAAGRDFTVKLCIAVNPLSGTGSRRLDGWVDESVSSERDNTWREQVLSINDLIAHFFSRGRGAANRSDWFKAPATTPERLPRSPGRDD
jgi:hypothetical protein